MDWKDTDCGSCFVPIYGKTIRLIPIFVLIFEPILRASRLPEWETPFANNYIYW